MQLFFNMDFRIKIAGILASVYLVFRRFGLLIIYPYKTMRKIANEQDLGQSVVILSMILVYFFIADKFRINKYSPFILFVLTIFNVLVTTFYLFFLSKLKKINKVRLVSFIITIIYTLLPTLIWFTFNTFLYLILPPPRNLTLLGKAFSIFYIGISIALLLWKIILDYLAVRFLTGFSFYRVLYIIILYVTIALPYSLLLYSLGLFRIPFI